MAAEPISLLDDKMGARVLISGVPYSGKSYLQKEFDRHDLRTVDTDTWLTPNAQQLVKDASLSWAVRHLRWGGPEAVDRRLRSYGDETVYAFGISADMLQCTAPFDKIVYLRASPQLLVSRFGKTRDGRPDTREDQRKFILMGAFVLDKTMELGAALSGKKGKIEVLDAGLPVEELFQRVVTAHVTVKHR